MSIFRFSALAPSTDREVPSQLYGTSHTIDWWRAAAVWGSALPGEGGGQTGLLQGAGALPPPQRRLGCWGVGKEAPGLRAGGWGGVVRVPHHLDAPLTCGVTHVALGHPLTPAPGHARRLPLLIGC